MASRLLFEAGDFPELKALFIAPRITTAVRQGVGARFFDFQSDDARGNLVAPARRGFDVRIYINMGQARASGRVSP